MEPIDNPHWTALVNYAISKHGLIELEGFRGRWLNRKDGTNVAGYRKDVGFGVKLTNAEARELALSVPGAEESRTSRWWIDVPNSQAAEWTALLDLAVEGEDFKGDTPGAEPNESGSPTSSVNALVQLAELHERGALTDEEFAAAKARLLGL